MAHLFGVGRGAFTGVAERRGALERAHGGTLFLDEVHNLPARVQRLLLRFLEDGELSRLGEPAAAEVDARLILGTNVPVEEAVADGRLAHDLVARLHRVAIPPLRERLGDVPEIFAHLLGRADPDRAEAALDAMEADVVEALLLRDYRDGNVRELMAMAAQVAAQVAEGMAPARALELTLRGPPQQSPAPEAEELRDSEYEANRELIVEAYREARGNLSKLERNLREKGIPASRRWLSFYLERWKVRSIQRRG